MKAVIETDNLTKKYGDLYAVRAIKLKLDEGDLFGFIGPNGAGKTTTMRIIATLLNPTWGEAYVCGNSIYTKAKEIRRLVGYMPDFFGVYDDMRVIEYLEFFAAAYRIKGVARRRRCNEMLEIVDLDFKRDAYANTLSRGQTQRLGLARTLLHDPQVLLLDEPLSGLDPRARIEMRNLLRRLGQMGKKIIVSRHILLGVFGGSLGFVAGVLAAVYFGAAHEGAKIQLSDMNFSWAGLLLASVGGAAALAVIAGWIPTMVAARQDPADVLRNDN